MFKCKKRIAFPILLMLLTTYAVSNEAQASSATTDTIKEDNIRGFFNTNKPFLSSSSETTPNYQLIVDTLQKRDALLKINGTDVGNAIKACNATAEEKETLWYSFIHASLHILVEKPNMLIIQGPSTVRFLYKRLPNKFVIASLLAGSLGLVAGVPSFVASKSLALGAAGALAGAGLGTLMSLPIIKSINAAQQNLDTQTQIMTNNLREAINSFKDDMPADILQLASATLDKVCKLQQGGKSRIILLEELYKKLLKNSFIRWDE